MKDIGKYIYEYIANRSFVTVIVQATTVLIILFSLYGLFEHKLFVSKAVKGEFHLEPGNDGAYIKKVSGTRRIAKGKSIKDPDRYILLFDVAAFTCRAAADRAPFYLKRTLDFIHWSLTRIILLHDRVDSASLGCINSSNFYWRLQISTLLLHLENRSEIYVFLSL